MLDMAPLCLDIALLGGVTMGECNGPDRPQGLRTLLTFHARIQGGAKGALAPPPSPQNIAPPNSEARAKRALPPPPPGAKRALPPPLQNPGSAYAFIPQNNCRHTAVW